MQKFLEKIKTKHVKIPLSNLSAGVKYDEDSTLAISDCVRMYNFDFTTNALRGFISFTRLKSVSLTTGEQTLTPIIEDACYKKLMFKRVYNKTNSKYMYLGFVYDDGTKTVKQFSIDDYLMGYILTVDSAEDFVSMFEYAFEGEEMFVIGLASGTSKIMTLDSSTSVSSFSAITHMCKLNDRYFIVQYDNPLAIVCIDDMDIRKWDGTPVATITFDNCTGGIKELFTLGDYMYAMMDNVIMKITYFQATKEMFYATVAQTNTKMIEETLVFNGSLAYFITSEGLNVFNGRTCEHFTCDLDKMLPKSDFAHATASVLNGKCYVAFNYDFDDGKMVGCETWESFINNVVVEINLQNGTCQIMRGIDVLSLKTAETPLFSKIIAIFNGNFQNIIGELSFNGEMLSNECLPCEYVSSYCDVDGTQEYKKLHKISLETETDMVITIKTNKEEKSFPVLAKEEVQDVIVDMIAQRFQISFQADLSLCPFIKRPILDFVCKL